MIIGIAGTAGSGKSTVADHLVAEHGFIAVNLADPIKRFCRDVFDFSEEQLWGPSEKRNEPDKRYLRWMANIPHMLTEDAKKEFQEGKVPQYLTPRHALQQLGTEWGRACYENVWVDYALRVASQILKKDYRVNQAVNTYHAHTGLRFSDTPYVPGLTLWPNGVVIPDVRFKNEVDAITKAGGKIWRVHRKAAGLAGAAGQHQSEQELDTIPAEQFSIQIYNDGTLDELYSMIDKSIPRT